MDDNMPLIPTKLNWGELNGDLLDLILSNLFGNDKISFSLVCKHWSKVAATSPNGHSLCLMYFYRRTRTWKFCHYNTFFNITFPDLENSELRCSKYGWLLMSRYDDTLFFFDPSNSRTLELPAKVDELYYPLSFFNPPTSPECVVVGIRTTIDSGLVKICILKLGDREWEYKNFPINEPEVNFQVLVGGPVLHRGLIYFVSEIGDVAILDIKERTLDINFDCLFPGSEEMHDVREQYLVKVNGEEALYGVFVFGEEREVSVFRFSSDMKWDSVEEGIGDKVFYISHNSCFGDKARSKSMENAICFPMFDGDVPVFYSLSDGKYHSINGGYLEGSAYGLKRLNRAAWLMPMPRPAQEVSTPTLSWL